MLTNKEMTEDEFNTWKEANSFLFDHLKELKDSYDEQVTVYAKNVLICDSQYLENVRLITAGFAGRASMLQELIDMEYSDIVEEDNDQG